MNDVTSRIAAHPEIPNAAILWQCSAAAAIVEGATLMGAVPGSNATLTEPGEWREVEPAAAQEFMTALMAHVAAGALRMNPSLSESTDVSEDFRTVTGQDECSWMDTLFRLHLEKAKAVQPGGFWLPSGILAGVTFAILEGSYADMEAARSHVERHGWSEGAMIALWPEEEGGVPIAEVAGYDLRLMTIWKSAVDSFANKSADFQNTWLNVWLGLQKP